MITDNINDDNKLRQKWLNKRNNAKKENIAFNLSFEEFCQLVKDANLVSSDLGYSGRMYVLARYNDTGDYSYNNCRFITQKENSDEKKISLLAIQTSIKNIQKMVNQNKLLSSEELSNRLKNSEKFQAHNKKRKELKEKNEEIRRSKLNPLWSNEKNSQYGTFWITNGTENKKWKDDKGEIPKGFYRGRI